ncbi:Arc family DNA-binding protein [Ancylobacter sp. VNQ12]|uniref:Arc family DNA-binding protein n=1 Tax=Ancylobacter sp. VNQ12 TaxID=3400920 RepID=UPI003C0818B8
MADQFPSEAADRFQVRLPDGLRARIKAHAEQQGRSMNTEIVRVLEEAFPAPLDELGSIHLDALVWATIDSGAVRTGDIGLALKNINAKTLIIPDIPDAVRAARGKSLIYAHFDRIVSESGVILKDRAPREPEGTN